MGFGSRRILLWGWMGFAVSINPASATPPPLPPRSYEVMSENGRCLARADVENRRITVFRIGPAGKTPVWTLEAYAPAMSPSDDCLSLVTTPAGVDWLFLGKGKPSDVGFTLYREGRRVRSVTLGDVYPDLESVARQYPGEFWYARMTWKDGHLVIHSVDGRTVMFSAASGAKVE